MTRYLQRLFDGASGLAPLADLRPTQRSQSPLVTVDQRFATPEFAANFGLGIVPEAPLPSDVPPEDGVFTASAQRPRVEQISNAAPRQLAPLRRDSDEADQPVPKPAVAPSAPAAPDKLRSRELPRHVSPLQSPSAPPGPSGSDEFELFTADIQPLIRESVTERILLADPATPPAASPSPPFVPAREAIPLPIATFESDISHAAESVMTRSRARPHAAESRPVDAPGALAYQAPTTRIMPAPPAQPGPLPPPASDAFDWSEIAPHVERLVRDTIAHERRPAPARPGEAGAAPAPAALPRPATAASASVIGALERPPRHTMLFGTRLR